MSGLAYYIRRRYYRREEYVLELGFAEGSIAAIFFCVFLSPKTYCLRIKVSLFLILFRELDLARYSRF